jgi:EF hand
LETVAADYAPKGVRFYYIYKALAHPETNGYVAPFTLKERLMHVQEAREKLGSRITWLCDSMNNDLKHALGDAPNSEFVIDPDGQIVISRRWSKPEELRADLAELVGEVSPVTTVADVGMKRLAPPGTAPKGVVPRMELPGRMVPLQVSPVFDASQAAEPFYVKLRAEVDQQFLRSDDGQLYLGFFLDPLYKVHWNNEAAPVRFEIDAPPGVQVTPTEFTAAEIEVPADADPREFLVTVEGKSELPITLTVKYFACDDAETFCKPVTQQYQIAMVQDRDGGSRRSSSGRSSNSRRPGGATAQSSQMNERREMMMKRFPLHNALDSDGDGEISAEELKSAARSLRQLDRNRDGRITADELRPSPTSRR